MNYTFRVSAISTAILLAMTSQQSALASGYHFGTQSVNVQATSNASTAEAESPATIFYNPAGLSKLPGIQVTGNLITAIPDVEYSNAQGRYFTGQSIVDNDTGSTTGSGSITDGPIFVPHAYASYHISPQFTAGVGVYVPFGANTKYDDSSIMRYSVKQTELSTININPAIAYDFQNGHSIGAGIIGQYMHAKLAKNIDFAPAIQSRLRDANVANPENIIKNGETDGTVNVEGDGWGVGFNLGWMWDINENARIGVNYRSQIEHKLKGDAQWGLVGPTFSNPSFGEKATAGIRGAGYVAEEGASVKIITPESLSLHGMVKVTPEIDLYGDVTWTRHSRFNTIDINYANDKTIPNVTGIGEAYSKSHVTRLKPNWHDTYKISLGGSYQLNDQWQLRSGIAYDRSPVTNPDDRLSTMPDNHRLWLSAGAKYDISDNQTLNFAYSYVHVDKATANTNGYCGGGIKSGQNAAICVSDRTNASADYKSQAHFVGLQYTYRF